MSAVDNDSQAHCLTLLCLLNAGHKTTHASFTFLHAIVQVRCCFTLAFG